MTEKIVVAKTNFYKSFKTKEEAVEHIKSGKAMTRELHIKHHDIESIFPPNLIKEAYTEFYKLLRDDKLVSTIDYSPFTKTWFTQETIVSIAQISINDFGDIVDEYIIIKGNTKKRFY